MSRRRGFTLIELLVVVAIIGLLAALFFPVFARARESSRQAICLSNLRQIGHAIAAYEDDWDGYYPIGRPTIDSFGTYHVLFLYLPDIRYLVCPSNQYPWYDHDPWPASVPPSWRNVPMTYTVNKHLTFDTDWTYDDPRSLEYAENGYAYDPNVSDTRDPAGLIVIAETRYDMWASPSGR